MRTAYAPARRCCAGTGRQPVRPRRIAVAPARATLAMITGLLGILLTGCSQDASAADEAVAARGVTASPPAPAGTRPPARPSAPSGATAAPTPGTTAPAGGTASALPAARPSAVFVGEACALARSPAPAAAINGLTLFCVPEDDSGSGVRGLGRWGTQPPSATQASPRNGGSCQSTDVGRVVRDRAGRPLSCLRDPNGSLTWSDVS